MTASWEKIYSVLGGVANFIENLLPPRDKQQHENSGELKPNNQKQELKINHISTQKRE